MRTIFYLIGAPGSGKTTALRGALDGYDRQADTVAGCPVVRLTIGMDVTIARKISPEMSHLPVQLVELGRDRDGVFAGTDALSMSIQPKAVAAMAELDGLVVAEGDRLANEKFWLACEETGWRVQVAYLHTPATTAAARREARGGGQNERWVQGRITKSRRLADRWGAQMVDGDGTPADVADRLSALIASAAAGT